MYLITYNDCTGGLTDVHPVLVQAMCSMQEKQGNKWNPHVFKENLIAGRGGDGFHWASDQPRTSTWHDLLVDKISPDMFIKEHAYRYKRYYPLNDKDIYGSLLPYPKEVVEALLINQYVQNGTYDIELLERTFSYAMKYTVDHAIVSSVSLSDTRHGPEFWSDVLINKNFNRFNLEYDLEAEQRIFEEVKSKEYKPFM